MQYAMYFLAIFVIPLISASVLMPVHFMLPSFFEPRETAFLYGLFLGFLNIFLAYLLFYSFDVELTVWLSIVLAGLKIYGGWVRGGASRSLETKKNQAVTAWGALVGIGISTFIFIV